MVWDRGLFSVVNWETAGFNRHAFRTPKIRSCETHNQTLEVSLDDARGSWEAREPFNTPGSVSNGLGLNVTELVIELGKKGQGIL